MAIEKTIIWFKIAGIISIRFSYHYRLTCHLGAAIQTIDINMAAHMENPLLTARKLCKFCQKSTGNYTCPKCNIVYCSLACYKHESHVKCTEKFYKNWVQTELKTREVSDEARQKMLQILANEKKEQEEEESETLCPPEGTIDARMAGVDLDDEKAVWERLSAGEKAEFAELIKQEQVEHFLPIWQPWWMTKEDLIMDAEAESQLSHPEILKNIPKINVNASLNVRFNIANVLCAYICTTKYYNGDYHLLSTEAAQTAAKLSRNIEGNENFPDVKSAIYSVVQTATELNFGSLTDARTILSLIGDLIHLINGPKPSTTSNVYISAALSDLHNLFQSGRKSDKNHQLTKETKNILIKSEKKFLFYLHWLQQNNLNITSELEVLRDISILEAETNKIHSNT
uniref:HIT-type domain-containing protein n=1 Tax=Strigamia maritima TaxID=126957 RepID=T1IW78_STRMM